MNLVIVESPAKCKKIAGFLGKGWYVLATMGHIRSLEENLEAIGIDRDFEPRFHFLKEKSKATKAILEAASGAKTIYLSADDDREGEAIAYSVACLLKKNPTSLPRAVFHEITEKAVKYAVEHPRVIDMNRVYAQQARAVLDMLVGFTISPLLWKHVGRTLSAGRCQTPALRLVSDREERITQHTSQTTWALEGDFKYDFSFQAKMDDELEDQESALNYLENIHKDPSATITSVKESPWTANPPKPLITSSLQQEASALHKINPKVTMKIAQKLYEAGHITYMRTDHAVLGEEATQQAIKEVTASWGGNYVGNQNHKDKKETLAQEAHEAIRPTHFEVKVLDDWEEVEKKIYTLIWKRAVQSVMAPAKGRSRTVKIRVSADDVPFDWTSSWRITEFAGWQIAGKPANLDEEEEVPEDEQLWNKSQSLRVGSILRWIQVKASPKRSKASPRFTEATLIRELEKRGIGRPSTFASLVEVLFDKEYIEKKDIPGTKINHTTLTLLPKEWPPLTNITHVSLGEEKQKLVPTALGNSVLGFCVREFPQLFAYEFTAGMEERLDLVSKGDEQWKELCKDTWNSYKGDYERLKDKASVPSTSEKVHDFGNGFKAVMSKTGPLLVQECEKGKATFYPFPPDKTVQEITEEEARDWIKKHIDDAIVGTFDGKDILKKKGPYGFYLQCGDQRIPFVDSDTTEQIIEKLSAKTKDLKYIFGPYTFGKGQYGPYMFKTALKTKVFVSVPPSIDIRKLTAEEADALYKNGIEAKKKFKSHKK